ncbi:MAG: hotdog fold thioesterase [Actinobacteria bacterium]|nr:hotdog fold thioesterase [Actinomycetota bacterium]
MTQNESFDYLAAIRARGTGELDSKMGIEIIEASPQRLVGTMPVVGNRQPMGLLHGGANVVLAESLGSIGSLIHAGPGRSVVGIDINATHHKSATEGIVTGVATAITLGKTLCVWDIVITNEAGERTCTARITCLILARRD